MISPKHKTLTAADNPALHRSPNWSSNNEQIAVPIPSGSKNSKYRPVSFSRLFIKKLATGMWDVLAGQKRTIRRSYEIPTFNNTLNRKGLPENSTGG
jgi:hypothetical protein